MGTVGEPPPTCCRETCQDASGDFACPTGTSLVADAASVPCALKSCDMADFRTTSGLCCSKDASSSVASSSEVRTQNEASLYYGLAFAGMLIVCGFSCCCVVPCTRLYIK